MKRSADWYVMRRIEVDKMINNVNGNEADWAAGMNECTVYGV